MNKAIHAAVGAPVVAGRRLGELKDKMWEQSKRWQTGLTDTARREFDLMAEEGERTAAKLRQQKVIEELQSRVDFDQLSDQVTRLKDQLESVLGNWKATFRPGDRSDDTAEDTAPAPAGKTPVKTPPSKAAKATAAKKAKESD